MDGTNSSSMLDTKEIQTSYCKYCMEQRYTILQPRRRLVVYEVVSKKTYEQLEPTMSPSELERWKKVPDLNVKKRICRYCFKNKGPNDIVVIKSPNYSAILTEKIKEKEKQKKLTGAVIKQENNSGKETLTEEMIKEGWIGPTTRTCMDPKCSSTTAYIKIRPPLSDDEPPMVIYRCAGCLKTNVDYKQ